MQGKERLLEVHRRLIDARNIIGRERPEPFTIENAVFEEISAVLRTIAGYIRDQEDREKNYNLFPPERET